MSIHDFWWETRGLVLDSNVPHVDFSGGKWNNGQWVFDIPASPGHNCNFAERVRVAELKRQHGCANVASGPAKAPNSLGARLGVYVADGPIKHHPDYCDCVALAIP